MRESGLARIECPISANRPPYRGPASGTNINLVAALHAITQKRKTSPSPSLSSSDRFLAAPSSLSLSLLYLMRFFWRRRRRNILEKRDEEYLYLFFGEVESKKGKEGCNRKNFERNRFLFEDRQEKVYNTDSTINVIDFLLSAR